ncbi:MAG: hypothetical protein HWD58_12005 [Bacteroidota bacterium]|nr:MAG: hypothetical protein HWD58_12005 [Bacteroidota bacterium]
MAAYEPVTTEDAGPLNVKPFKQTVTFKGLVCHWLASSAVVKPMVKVTC